jgi:hypothetical protein
MKFKLLLLFSVVFVLSFSKEEAFVCEDREDPACSRVEDASACGGITQGTGTFHVFGLTSSQTGVSECNATTIELESNGSVFSLVNPGLAGDLTFSADYYNGGLSLSSAVQVLTPSGQSYVSESVSGSWSGNIMTINASMKNRNDIINGDGKSYCLTATVTCN